MASTALARRGAAKPARSAKTYDVLLVSAEGDEEALESGVAKTRATAVNRALRSKLPEGMRVLVRPSGTPGLARAARKNALERAAPIIRGLARVHHAIAAPTYELGRATTPAVGRLTRALIGELAASSAVRDGTDSILREIANLISPAEGKETR